LPRFFKIDSKIQKGGISGRRKKREKSGTLFGQPFYISGGLTAPIRIIILFVIFSDNANRGGVNVVVGRIKK
jgi:hypothetical protein